MSSINHMSPSFDDINSDTTTLLKVFKTRWKLITSSILLGGIVSTLHTLATPYVWTGYFQIVADTSKGKGQREGLSEFASNVILLPGSQGTTALETEVRVIRSPSLLKPVYMRLRNTPSLSKLDIPSFDNWSKNVNVMIEKGSSVLYVSYNSSKKSSIIPTLDAIGLAIQEYSIKERNSSLNRAVSFVESQLDLYRARATKSTSLQDQMRLEYGIIDTGTGSGGVSASISVDKVLSDGVTRGGAESGQRTTIPDSDSLKKLLTLNQQIIAARRNYKDSDPYILQLIEARDSIRHHLENTAIGVIGLPEKDMNKQQSLEIALKYNQVSRKASRDRQALSSLESSLQTLQMEQARTAKPWNIISPPTVLVRPVQPRPALSLFAGTGIGLLLGTSIAIWLDRRLQKVFTQKIFSQYINWEFLLQLPCHKDKSWDDFVKLLTPQLSTDSRIVFFATSSDVTHLTSQMASLFKDCHSTVSFSDNIQELHSFDQVYLVFKSGSLSSLEIEKVNQKLLLVNSDIKGWILLSD